MKLHRMYIHLGIFVLLLALSSCQMTSISQGLSVWIINQRPIEPSIASKATLCLGGLRVKVFQLNENKVNIDELVQPEFELTRSLDAKVYEGMHAEVEAWCYDEDNTEIGYTKMIGVTDFLQNVPGRRDLFFSVRVSLPIADEYCNAFHPYDPNARLPDVQTRGRPPCIGSSLQAD